MEANACPSLPDRMEIVADPRFATQMDPSGACARVCGETPVGISNSRVLVFASRAETDPLSGLTHQTRERPVSRMMEEEWVGRTAVGRVWTVMGRNRFANSPFAFLT